MKKSGSKAVIPSHLVIKGFVLAFLCTVVILAGLAWYTWRSNRHLKMLETTHFRLLQLSGQIVHIDEVLTMSAHMAVETGEPEWEHRYRNFEPLLASAINEVIELSPGQFIRDAIARTDIANIKLVEMENRAFDLIRQGQLETASKVLHSAEYTEQKKVYSKGINEISDNIGIRERARIKKEQRIAFTVIVLLIVTMPLIAFIWFSALRILRRYIVERKQAELALSMAEQRFRAIADYTYFWEIWVSPGGNPIWTNPAVERVTGYSAPELMAMRDYPMAMVYEKDRDKVDNAFKSALDGSTGKEMEFRLLRKDGTRVWVETAWQPIFDDKGVSQGHRVSIHDITDRKQAELALRNSEQRYRALVENIELGIVLVDVDYNLVMANASISNMFRCNISEIIGTKCYEKFGKRQEICVHCPGQKAMETGHTEDIETERFRDDGSRFVVRVQAFPLFDENGRSTGFIALIEDVTKRREEEEEVREIQERFRDFFENAPIGFHIIGPDQIITDINDAELEMIGYSRKAIVGRKKWEELIVPQQRDMFKKHWREVAAGENIRNIEYTLVHKDGHHIDVILNASTRFDKDGSILNTRGSVLNITARKQAEQARYKLTRELEAKNKELESILYAASHDLKSPLVNIQGFSYELAQSCELIRSTLAGVDKVADTEKTMKKVLTEDIPKSLDYILAGSMKMDALLSGLLDVSRLNTAVAEAKHIDMNAMMSNITKSLEYQLKESAAIIDVEDLPPCTGDPLQINRVFTNLLTNALKFLDDSRPGKIRIYGQSAGDNCMYCVEDNGIGIAPEHQEKMFQIFYQHEPDMRQGEGIGLTIVRRIVEKHDGEVWMESKPGTGSKFFVTLPNI